MLRRHLWRSLAVLAAAVPLFRSGATLPGSAAPFQAGPDPSQPSAKLRERRRLRSSLRSSMAEGVLAEVVTACAGGAVLTGWALHLDASPVLIGLLGSLPFASQFVQLPAAWLTCLAGYRRVALWAVGLSRQVLWPLVVLPFLPLSPEAQQTVLLAVAAASAVLGVIGNNAWVAWMGELVPRRLRGRYFGRRTALCTLGGTIAALAAGIGLDVAEPRGLAGETLAALALIAVLAGAATVLLMRRQHQPTEVGGRARFRLALAIEPLLDPRTRRIIAYQLGWNLAIGVSSAFFAVHMLQNLKMGFALMAAYNAATAAVRILTGPLWGKAIDRVGARTVMTACSFGVVVVPLLWLLPQPGFLLPLLLELVLAGALWAGHGLAAFALPLALTPSQNRPFYLATFATASGLAFAAAATFGGWVVAVMPSEIVLAGRVFYGIQTVFVISALGRFAAAFLSLRIHDEDGRPVRELWHLVSRSLRPLTAGLQGRTSKVQPAPVADGKRA